MADGRLPSLHHCAFLPILCCSGRIHEGAGTEAWRQRHPQREDFAPSVQVGVEVGNGNCVRSASSTSYAAVIFGLLFALPVGSLAFRGALQHGRACHGW